MNDCIDLLLLINTC